MTVDRLYLRSAMVFCSLDISTRADSVAGDVGVMGGRETGVY